MPDKPGEFSRPQPPRRSSRPAARRAAPVIVKNNPSADQPLLPFQTAQTPTLTSPAPAPQPTIHTPSQLNRLVDQTLKREFPVTLHVQGELSNVNPISTGHRYFKLKDEFGTIACTMWAGQASTLKFAPENGMEVIAHGRVEIFAKAGQFQLNVHRMELAGHGAMEQARRELIDRLRVKNLLSRDRLLLPRFPRCVALVTSPQAAGYADMRKVFAGAPQIRLMLFPVRVQGPTTAAEVSGAILAIARAARTLGIDAIILARGGGSMEDLWPFNDEQIARAILSASINHHVPVVTGLGHETDTHVADLVSDYHAHTPTEAASVVAKQWRQAPQVLANLSASLGSRVVQHFVASRRHFDLLAQHQALRQPADVIVSPRVQELDELTQSLERTSHLRLLARQRQLQLLENRLTQLTPARQLQRQFDRLIRLEQPLRQSLPGRLHRFALLLARQEQRLDQFTQRCADRWQSNVRQLGARLDALSPLAVLARGYSITTDSDGKAVRDAADAPPGSMVHTRLHQGTITSRVEPESVAKIT